MNQTEMVQEFMRNIVRQIALLDIEQMRHIQDEARGSRQYWDSVGGLIDPTTYRNMLANGTWEHSRMQTEVVDHLVAIRKLIDDMDNIARENISKKGMTYNEMIAKYFPNRGEPDSSGNLTSAIT